MKKRYGNLYKVSEFIWRLIPKISTISESSQDYILSIIEFLKKLDTLQENNWSITIRIHASDGIYLYHNLKQQFFIKPTQKHLLFHIFEKNKLLSAINSQSNLFQNKFKKDYAIGIWKISHEDELQWLLNYIDNNFEMTKETYENNSFHPRNIPGYVRQAILEEFEKNGRYCNGVSGKTKRHKVKLETPIEFDHILPYSKRGSSDYRNVQILCKECNRIKASTAK
jgi:hypothetical protein